MLLHHGCAVSIVSMKMDDERDAKISCDAADICSRRAKLCKDDVDVMFAEKTPQRLVGCFTGLQSLCSQSRVGNVRHQFLNAPNNSPLGIKIPYPLPVMGKIRIGIGDADLWRCQELLVCADEVLQDPVIVDTQNTRHAHGL